MAILPYNFAAGLGASWLQTLWVALALTLYRWLARGDARSALRQIAGFLGFVAGLVAVLVGVEQAFEVTLRWVVYTGEGFATEFAFRYEFIGPLAVGLVVMAIYASELLAGGGMTSLGRQGTELTLIALAAAICGIPFYVGVAQVDRGLLEVLVRGIQLSPAEWALALALLFASAAHVALAYLLRVRTTGDAPSAPRRAYTLGALAAGSLTATIGTSMGLYIVVTAALGSPVSAHWGLDARTALVNTLVGLFITGLYLWRFYEQRRAEPQIAPIASRAATPAAPAPVPEVTGETVADRVGKVLDELVASRISREQASERLHALLPSSGTAREEVPLH